MIDIIRKTLPQGVRLSVHEHQEEHSEARYVQTVSLLHYDKFILKVEGVVIVN